MWGEQEVKSTFDMFDEDGNGKIDFNEFKVITDGLMKKARSSGTHAKGLRGGSASSSNRWAHLANVLTAV